jgi:hypothetical protein
MIALSETSTTAFVADLFLLMNDDAIEVSGKSGAKPPLPSQL